MLSVPALGWQRQDFVLESSLKYISKCRLKTKTDKEILNNLYVHMYIKFLSHCLGNCLFSETTHFIKFYNT